MNVLVSFSNFVVAFIYGGGGGGGVGGAFMVYCSSTGL